jgi:hypothetical protein
MKARIPEVYILLVSNYVYLCKKGKSGQGKGGQGRAKLLY